MNNYHDKLFAIEEDFSNARLHCCYSTCVNNGIHSNAINHGLHSVALTTGFKSSAQTYDMDSISFAVGTGSSAVAHRANSIAFASGYGAKAKASRNSWLVLVEYEGLYQIKNIKAVKVDGIKIKADSYYQLKDNKIIECENQQEGV